MSEPKITFMKEKSATYGVMLGRTFEGGGMTRAKALAEATKIKMREGGALVTVVRIEGHMARPR